MMKTADQLKIIVWSFLSIVVMVGVITLVSMQTTKMMASHGEGHGTEHASAGEHGTEHADATDSAHHEDAAAGAKTAATPETHEAEEVHEEMAADASKEAPKEAAATQAVAVKGDAEAGKAVFLKAANMCATCHAIDGVEGAIGAIGPKLDGLGERAATRVPGQDAVAYIKASIENPNGYVVENYAPAMPAGLNKNMSAEEYDNLVAYLVSL